MAKIWAKVNNGVIFELISLEEHLVPGADIYTPAFAADMMDVTATNPPPQIGWVFADGRFSEPSPVPVAALDLLAYAADKRWQLEIGGITVGDHVIATDRASQAMIAGADALAQSDPEADVDFKAASGWVTLDAATLHVLALAVGRHVRGLFARERIVAEAIAAGDITTAAEIDAAFAG